MNKRHITIILVLTLLLMNIPSIIYAASVSSSINKTSLQVGEKAVITVSVSDKNGMIQLDVSSSGNLGVLSNRVVSMENKVQITVEALKVGSGNVRISGFAAPDPDTRLNINKTFTVNVVEKPAPKPDPKPQPSNPTTSKPGTSKPPQIDNTEKEKTEPKKEEKTPEQIEREELEKRMKTSLIREIQIISNSERLKGQVLTTMEAESEKFEYDSVTPWNINDLNLDVKAIKEDVKLEYPKDISFEEGKDSLEVVIKAKQDKLEQEFKIRLKKPQESKLLINYGDKNLKQIVDPYLDRNMEKLGLEKLLIDSNDESQGFYYGINKYKLVVAVDGDNQVSTFLLDDKLNIISEVFLVTNGEDKLSILLNKELPQDDQRTLMENSYEEHEIVLAKLLTEFDTSLKYNNKLRGWLNGEGIITHGLLDINDSELVYLYKTGEVKSAFVSFDLVAEKTIDIFKYLGYVLWIVTSIIFAIYAFRNSRIKSSSL